MDEEVEKGKGNGGEGERGWLQGRQEEEIATVK